MPLEQTVFALRRKALRARMKEHGGGVLLLPAAEERLRNADSEYPFRQDSDFAWLCGLDEPTGCALLFSGAAPSAAFPAAPSAGSAAQARPPPAAPKPAPSPSSHQRAFAPAAAPPPPEETNSSAPAPSPATPGYVLFVRPRDPKMELWTGRRTGVEGARSVYGATEAFPEGEVEARLAPLLDGAGTLWFRFGQDAAWDARVGAALRALRGRERRGARPPVRLVDAGELVHEARLVKAPEELACLRRAAALTAEGHLAAMREGRPGRREYEVQAAIEYAFRRPGGGGPGYGTIVAAGVNATILHYRAAGEELREGELCLVDAGGEWSWYTADVTRTFPISGRFTEAQRAAYEVVLEAELAGIEATRPGATVDGIHDLVVRRLVEGMIRLGLLTGTAEERVADRSYEKYYMHRTSHWLGLDVHDVGRYRAEGEPRPLVPGMVLTMEPGLYVPADDTGAPEALRGLGLRIEDNLVVTEGGCENLTAAVPKTVEEVEAACSR